MGITNTIAKLKSYFEAWHNAEKSSHIELIYPVGSIYMSVNDTNPASLFGGNWEKIEGRFLLGSSNNYPLKTNNDNTTGGSKDAVLIRHTHVQDRHTHTQSNHTHGNYEDSSGNIWKHLMSDGDIKTANTGYSFSKLSGGSYFPVYSPYKKAGNIIQRNTGPGQASLNGTIATNQMTGDVENGVDKNMPPYLVVNIWKRTE